MDKADKGLEEVVEEARYPWKGIPVGGEVILSPDIERVMFYKEKSWGKIRMVEMIYSF